MKKLIIKGFVLASMMFFVSGIMLAQDRKGPKQKGPNVDKMFKKMDTNQDGLISVQEAEEGQKDRVARRFETTDVNKDGYLSREEVLAGKKQKKRRKSKMNNLDINNDKKFSLEEVKAAGKPKMLENFPKIDTDQDGYLTKEELKAFKKNR